MINDLLNKLSYHTHNLLIDFEQMPSALKVLDELDVLCKRRIYMGNCGWAKAPSCWFFHFLISDYKWYQLLKRFKEEEINLLPETIGY